MLVDNPWFYVLAIPLVLLTGISKGGFANGLGAITVPLLTMVIDPRHATGIMLPILCAMDLSALWKFRGVWDSRCLKIMLPGALIGITVGTLTFQYLDADMLRLIVGVVALYFVGNYLVGKIRRIEIGAKEQNVVKGGFFGMLSGFTSFVAHAGGPPAALYMLPLKMDKTRLVGTSVVFFAAVNFVKLIPYGFLGQLSAENLMTSLVLMPLAPLGIWIGAWLHHHASDRLFYFFFYGVLFLVGIKLTAEGLMALL